MVYAQPRPRPAQTPPQKNAQVERNSRAAHRKLTSPFIPNRYTLVLRDAPVAERFASRDAMATPAAESYRRQVESVQSQVKSTLAARNYRVLGSVSLLGNAVFVAAPASAVADLRSIPGVASVVPARRMRQMLNRATALANVQQAWTSVGGQSGAGAGIKIAVIDSGVDQTHPALQDSSLSMPSGFPKGTTSYTTNKVIVARSYIAMDSDTNPAFSTPDDFSPRDHQGHGTFNAIIAAGNSTPTPAVSTTGGGMTISGVAPKAWVGNYRVEGSPGVIDGASDQALIAAVNDAVADGMDVITCSIGGLAISDAASDPLASAFEKATQFAVVIASAGNDGSDSYLAYFNGSINLSQGFGYPGFNTISTPSNAPDVISVGATLNSHVLQPAVSVTASGAPSNLQSMPGLIGDSYYLASSFTPASQAPLIDVATLGNNGQACAALPANSLNGAFALILQGSCGYDTPALNAQNAGAVGFVYYASSSSSLVYPEGINETGPAVMVSNASGTALKSYLASHPGANTLIDLSGSEQDVATWNTLYGIPQQLNVAAQQFASYSSMGPTPDGMLKPDMVAVGGFDALLFPDPNNPYLPPPGGMYSGTQNYDPNSDMWSMNRWGAGDGTSFATPMVAGAAALLKQKNSKLTPGQIRSLLIDYAQQTTNVDDFGDPVDAEFIGAGGLDANASINAPVAASPATISFGVLNSATLPITQTITLTNISSASVTMSVSISCCMANATSGKPSFTVAASSSSVTIAAGASTTLNISLSGTKPSASEYSGFVVLQNSSATMRIPFMALQGNGLVYNVLPEGGGEGPPSTDLGYNYVQLTDQYGVPVAGTGVTYTVSPRGSMTLQSVQGAPACSPASSSTSVTCPTDQFGNSYVEVVTGASLTPNCYVTGACAGVSFVVGGNSGSFSYNVQNNPSITAVSDAAAGKTPVAPGSYVSIYGNGLAFACPTDANGNPLCPVDNSFTDYLAANGTYTVLPMALYFTNVSFDVPSANISVPARMVYVSPTQINIQVPWEMQGQSSALVKVILDQGTLISSTFTVPIASYQPTFFTYGSNIADALDGNYALITTTNPAKRGSSIAFFANGLGPVSNQPATGDPASATNISNTNGPVTVSFGGVSATASFAGLAPGFPGLYQINVTVPAGVTPGSAVPVTLTVGGVTSPQATLPIQ